VGAAGWAAEEEAGSFRKEDEAEGGGGGIDNDEVATGAEEGVARDEAATAVVVIFRWPRRDLYSDISSLRRGSMIDCQT
jgi:hypothetical protein